MNISKATHKIKEQIAVFSGKLSAGMPKAAGRFLAEALYGIQARQSVRLSEWGRSLNEDIPLIKTINRLSRQLDRSHLWEMITAKILHLGKEKIKEGSLLIVDISDISKVYARSMEYISRVRDGSKEELADGYWTIQVAAAERGESDVIPLYGRLYSVDAPDCWGENAEIIKAVETVSRGVDHKGIWVIDRGGDRRQLLEFLLGRGARFIIRMKGDRHLLYRGGKIIARELADKRSLPYREVLIREEKDTEKRYDISFGYCPVQLPGLRIPLYMVVVTGFGQEPMMILTNLPMRKNRAVIYGIVESYITRWKIEETIRFLKQSYHLEDVRVLTYNRLQNMMALILAVAYFSMVYLGQRLKMRAVAGLLLKASKRIFGIPDFRFYALADGIWELLKRSERGPLRPSPTASDHFQLNLRFT
jgi:hypothetical protein